MIFDSIKNMENYKNYPELYSVLRFLHELESEALPAPDTVIREGTAFCNPVVLTSKDEADCVYEAHRKYIDLHYIVEGSELIRTADPDFLEPLGAYDPEKDIRFFSGSAFGSYVLNSGDFMVCYPSDAHKVAIAPKEPSEIRKIVVKIKA